LLGKPNTRTSASWTSTHEIAGLPRPRMRPSQTGAVPPDLAWTECGAPRRAASHQPAEPPSPDSQGSQRQPPGLASTAPDSEGSRTDWSAVLATLAAHGAPASPVPNGAAPLPPSQGALAVLGLMTLIAAPQTERRKGAVLLAVSTTSAVEAVPMPLRRHRAAFHRSGLSSRHRPQLLGLAMPPLFLLGEVGFLPHEPVLDRYPARSISLCCLRGTAFQNSSRRSRAGGARREIQTRAHRPLVAKPRRTGSRAYILLTLAVARRRSFGASRGGRGGALHGEGRGTPEGSMRPR
jgi:hypothetical protein